MLLHFRLQELHSSNGISGTTHIDHSCRELNFFFRKIKCILIGGGYEKNRLKCTFLNLLLFHIRFFLYASSVPPSMYVPIQEHPVYRWCNVANRYFSLDVIPYINNSQYSGKH